MSADHLSVAYSVAMLNAAAAARNQQQLQGTSLLSPTASTTTTHASSSPSLSSHHASISPSSQQQHQLQLLQQIHAQENSSSGGGSGAASLLKSEAAQVNSYNPVTVGALLKMQNSSSSTDALQGGGVAAGSNAVNMRQVKNGQAFSLTPSGSLSPTGKSATPLVRHLQDPVAAVTSKFGSPSSHHSPNPQTSSPSLTSKRPPPIQIGSGINRFTDDTAIGGVPAPTTPASPYTSQQGW